MSKNWLVTNLNKKYFLKARNKIFSCQIGEGGFTSAKKKVEGDKTTPIGKWSLEKLYYRSDKILRPNIKKKNLLKINQITKYCAWCDDFRSNYYNKYINIDNSVPSNINYEKLWREDDAYDIVIVISHNIKPTIKKKGSAIFIHCSFSDYRKTAGCITLKKKDLVFLLKNLQHKTHIKIKI